MLAAQFFGLVPGSTITSVKLGVLRASSTRRFKCSSHPLYPSTKQTVCGSNNECVNARTRCENGIHKVSPYLVLVGNIPSPRCLLVTGSVSTLRRGNVSLLTS